MSKSYWLKLFTESDVVINEYRSDEQKKYIYMEPRPNAIIYAFYSHDRFNDVEPFVSQSSETKTRPKHALRRKLVFLSYVGEVVHERFNSFYFLRAQFIDSSLNCRSFTSWSFAIKLSITGPSSPLKMLCNG